MLPHLAGMIDPELWFAKRSIKFISMYMKSDNNTVKTISMMGVNRFKQLLEKCTYVTLHIRCLRIISTEVFKSLSSLNPSFMKEMFNVKETCYNLRVSSVKYLPSFNKIIYKQKHISILWFPFVESFT